MCQWKINLESLRQGDSSQWPKHEFIRTGNPSKKHLFEATPTYGKPVWNGENTRVLVNADFGLGDTIHFYRFLRDIQAKKVILRCDEDLHGLFQEVETISKDVTLPDFDHVIHMMAVPGITNSTIHGKPYLHPNKNFPCHPLVEKLPEGLIGICWCGNPFNPRDSQRSIPVKHFVELFKQWNVRPISLVKHEAPPSQFLDGRALLGNWNDTAYLLEKLKLVITVDTAIAHLAGAMGKPTYLIIPNTADWRWGTENHTIWYDSITIIRHQQSKMQKSCTIPMDLESSDGK